MKKIALGVVAALLLAAFPLSASVAGAVSEPGSQVRFINATSACTGGPPGSPVGTASCGTGRAIDIYGDGAALRLNLNPGTNVTNYFDTALAEGVTQLQVCYSANPQGLASSGACANGLSLLPAGGPVPLNLTGGGNFDIYISDAGPNAFATQFGGAGPLGGIDIFANSTAATDENSARLTVDNTGPVALFVCVNSTQVLGPIAPGTGQEVTVEQEQQSLLQIGSVAGCTAAAARVNFVGGTNFIVGAVAIPGGGSSFSSCTADCGQVLFVDIERHPNVANSAAFCATVPALATVQSTFKALLGGVNPNDSLTYPARGDVSDWVHLIESTVTGGDYAVPGDIKLYWEVITAGLRQLAQTFRLVDFDVAGFPPAPATLNHVTLEQLVEAANGFSLPGTANADLQAAITALTNWYKANCGASPSSTPAAPAATPASAGPRFTG